MSGEPIFDVIAQAVVAEGCTAHFTLMGDANMFFANQLAQKYGMKTYHVRHEHSAISMADGYHRVSGEVGLASVTCGPGFTQVATALTMAARGNIPLVAFVGDPPLNAAYHVQAFDPGPLTATTGAAFVPIRHIDRVVDCVREAFYIARFERRPVVLAVPMDMQKAKFPHVLEYRSSLDLVPTPQRIHPDPAVIEKAADMIAAAERIVILGGRGAWRSEAGPTIEQLAEQIGAVLGTALLGKGLFDHSPYSIGTAGVFATDPAREIYANADLVIGIGAALGHYTTEGGYLYPEAKVIQIDTNPRGLFQGLRIADHYIKADARAATEALIKRLRERGITKKGLRTPELTATMQVALARPDPKEMQVTPGLMDPREAMLELDKVIPKDWEIVVGSAHFFSIALTHLRGRLPQRYHVINDFGAIGSGLTAAVGIAAARKDGKVLLIEGDGSTLMQVQEYDVAARHNVKFLTCVMNDGGLGSEAHKLRSQGIDPREAITGRNDFAAIAKSYGLRGTTVNKLGNFEALFKEYEKGDTATIWDLHVDDKIPSKLFRRAWFGEL